MAEIILDGSPNDRVWIRATMLFPNDDTARKQCFGIELARFKVLECKSTDRLEIDADDLRLLIEAPAYEVLKNIVVANIKRAVVAGDILMTLYIMNKYSVPKPSMNKAIFVAQEYAKTGKYRDGTRMNVSERIVRKCWEEYLPVAHLWAAYRINRAYPYAPADDIFGQTKFLEMAVELYRFGTGFVPSHTKHKTPVLNAEKCWALPDSIPAGNLEPDRAPHRLLKYLKRYKAPKSRM